MQQNLASFFAATNEFFSASVAAEAIRQRRIVLQATQPELHQDQAAFETAAQALVSTVAGFPTGDLQETKKTSIRRKQPLTAAVAFDKLAAAGAASLAAQLNDLQRNTALSTDEKFSIFAERLGFLEPMREIAQAEGDVLTSYASWVSALRSQTDSNALIAESLAKATTAEVNPAAFTSQLLGNDTLTLVIAEAVRARTKDPKRAAAAEKLIGSLGQEK